MRMREDVKGGSKVSVGTETVLKDRRGEERVASKNIGSVSVLIIQRLRMAHFQIFLTAVIFTQRR